ncbi:MAG: type II secretion system protein [Deltaproteobacteria bacterium]|jgi:prepilin-type N-terminal cleavage/methylation domain-containing protein|nr:type II secretion system GspH family protein [Deltaproteobacteria bacterium]MCL5879710.1 type II secretion system GspH family protein [Deltaproteobacteria bacterium]MDA8304139.1 type II secretion system protein [Deltaproteobacteria bacterium]
MRSKSHDLTSNKATSGEKGLRVIRNNEAFTLIELVMVILLIGILAAVVLPKFINLTGSANKAASKGVIGSLGEALTTQLSKNLVNNDLSSYITVKAGVPTLNGKLAATGASGDNPYNNPFLLLPNYTISAANAGTGTVYNYGAPSTPLIGNSWWLNYAVGTPSAKGTNGATPVTITLTCDNSAAGVNPTYLAPTLTVPNNEYITQLGNVDYNYSNGVTMDSYAYYMVSSVNNNIDGFYFVPCQTS